MNNFFHVYKFTEYFWDYLRNYWFNSSEHTVVHAKFEQNIIFPTLYLVMWLDTQGGSQSKANVNKNKKTFPTISFVTNNLYYYMVEFHLSDFLFVDSEKNSLKKFTKIIAKVGHIGKLEII